MKVCQVNSNGNVKLNKMKSDFINYHDDTKYTVDKLKSVWKNVLLIITCCGLSIMLCISNIFVQC